MAGIPVGPGLEVLPGVAKEILHIGRWQDLSLIVYTDGPRVFVVQNGSILLQTLQSDSPVLSGSVCSESGSLALLWESGLLEFYQPVLLFSRPLRFEPRASQWLYQDARSISWISSARVAVGFTSGRVLELDSDTLSVLWQASPPTGGSQVVGTSGHIFQFGYGLSKLWTQNSATEEWVMEYIPSPSPVNFARWLFLGPVGPVLVIYSTDNVVRVWKCPIISGEPDLAEFWWSHTLDPVELPMIAEDRGALLLVVSGPQATRYCRLSAASGLSISHGPPLGVPSASECVRVDPGGFLYAHRNGGIDVYTCQNWEPRYRSTLTGISPVFAGITKVQGFSDGFITFGSGTETVLWNDLRRAEIAPSCELVTYSASGELALYSNDTIHYGKEKWPSQGLLGLHEVAEGVIGVYRSEMRLWPSEETWTLPIKADIESGADGEVCIADLTKVIYGHWQTSPFSLKVEATIELADIKALSVSGTGLVAAITSKGTTWIWSPNDDVLDSIEVPGSATEAAWFSDMVAIIASGVVYVYIFNTSILRWICVRTLHLTASAQSIAWLRDGSLVVSTAQNELYVQSQSIENDSQVISVVQDLALGYPKTLSSLRMAIQADMPVYHPEFLVDLVASGRLEGARKVLHVLASVLRYATVDEHGVAEIDDRFLGLTATDLNIRETDTDSEKITQSFANLSDLLSKSRLPGLTAKEQTRLDMFASIAAKLDASFDIVGTMFIVLHTLNGGDASYAVAFVWAYFSKCKAALLDAVGPIRTFADMNRNGLAFWLEQDQLRSQIEELSRICYANTRDPVQVSVCYLALGKKAVLQNLWKVCAGHPERDKTMKLLSHDFSQARWRTAALKNAFALLSKHRYSYAAALFLLGGSLSDCCQTLAGVARDPALAVAIARICVGSVISGNNDTGEAEKGTVRVLKMLKTRFWDAQNDQWLQCWASVSTGDWNGARTSLERLASVEPRAVWLLHHALGGASSEEIAAARRAYIRRRCPLLIDLLPDATASPEIPSHFSPASARNESIHTKDTDENGAQEPSEDTKPGTTAETWKAGRKAPPTHIQLEPDMAAFGF